MYGRVILDVQTTGLEDAQFNLSQLPELINFGMATHMVKWYEENCKKEMLKVIESGKPDIPINVGKYRQWKIRKYGIDHGLGILSGGLYFGVSSSIPRITRTRANEVRMAVVFNAPFYVAVVHDGSADGKIAPRRFAQVAMDRTLSGLLNKLNKMFDSVDLTQPYPEVRGTVLASKG